MQLDHIYVTMNNKIFISVAFFNNKLLHIIESYSCMNYELRHHQIIFSGMDLVCILLVWFSRNPVGAETLVCL